MINDDTLIRFSLRRIEEDNNRGPSWVDRTRMLNKQIKDLLTGFPGIGMNDISIHRKIGLIPGQIIFLDPWLDDNSPGWTDEAPILGRVISSGVIRVEGVGNGTDFERDPERKIQFGSPLRVDLTRFPTIVTLDSKPRVDGGPVYYYFMKHPRDSRW